MWRWLIVAVVASLILSSSVAADDFDEALKKLKDKDPVKRVSGLRALGKIGDMKAVQHIITAFKDPHPRVREKAAEALERIKDKEVLGWLRDKVLQHGDREIRRYTAMAFGMMKKPDLQSIPVLKKLLRDRDPMVVQVAARALAHMDAKEAFPDMESCLKSKAWLVRAEAVKAMAVLDSQKAIPHVKELLKDKAYQVVLTAMRVLAEHEKEAGVDEALKALKSKSWQVKAVAATVLGRHPAKRSIEPLIAALRRERGRLRHDFSRALKEITGMSIGPDAQKWATWWKFNKDYFEIGKGGGSRGQFEETMVRVQWYGMQVLSKRFAFVLDLSSSMGDVATDPVTKKETTKLNLANQELAKVIKMMDPDVYFNIIFFAKKIEPWRPRLMKGSKGNRAACYKFVMERKASGPTMIYDALEKAFEDPNLDTVYLLTDGAPSGGKYNNRGEIMEKLADMNEYRVIQVHTVEIGTAGKRWKGFMKAIAESTGGDHVKRGGS
jgi:HEAT repeat protein